MLVHLEVVASVLNILEISFCSYACVWLVDRALDTKTDEIVALKKMRMENEKDGKILVHI